MTDTRLFIKGEHVEATGDAKFERRNPISGEVATTAAAATPDDARTAVAAAAGAFPAWSTTGPGERRALTDMDLFRREAFGPLGPGAGVERRRSGTNRPGRRGRS